MKDISDNILEGMEASGNEVIDELQVPYIIFILYMHSDRDREMCCVHNTYNDIELTTVECGNR